MRTRVTRVLVMLALVLTILFIAALSQAPHLAHLPFWLMLVAWAVLAVRFVSWLQWEFRASRMVREMVTENLDGRRLKLTEDGELALGGASRIR